jgi:hypothetical protein
MIDWYTRRPAHRRMLVLFWLLNAAIVAALLVFALRG